MLRKRGFWISLFALAVIGGGGYAYYSYVYLPDQEPPEPVITTAQVRRGDLVVSVSGSGTLVAVSEIELGFKAEGYLDEVLVEVGDQVQEGDVLARLEIGDLEVDVVEAEIAAREAQLDLADASEGPTDVELADAEASLQSAQAALVVAEYAYDSVLNSDLDSAVRSRQIEYQWSVDRYWKLQEDDADQSHVGDAGSDWSSTEAALNDALRDARMEELDSWNQVDQARDRIYQAEESLELLRTGPTADTIMRAELRVTRATLALDDARGDLEAAELLAPFDGTVVKVSAIPGEQVSTAPFITMADLEEPLMQFWVEEADLSGVAVGNRVENIFEALPDDTFDGEVVRVDPALVTVDGTLAVQAWAGVDFASPPVNLFGGMNSDVEVISAEARDALLVPLQALRELGPDQHAVFVVQPDGELVLRPVEVGLMDFVNAEIVSGLEFGEVVSMGVEEGTETEAREQTEPPRNPMMRFMGG